MIEFAVAAACAVMRANEELRFHESLKNVPPDVALSMMNQRKAQQEKARQEAVIERRHREHMDALERQRWAIIMSRI